MKKMDKKPGYFRPESEVVALQVSRQLLAGSDDWVDGGAGTYTDDNIYDNGSY
ncbi:MAG: hypothetical protein J5871_05685 [Bacteroidales bacterium]|nr:hypothetical protein [Bacteroidales bacterium]